MIAIVFRANDLPVWVGLGVIALIVIVPTLRDRLNRLYEHDEGNPE